MRVVDPQEAKTEIWKNGTAGLVGVLKHNRKGELEHEIVASGRTITVTPEERRINQEMAASDDLDFFKNGVMVPVRLIDGEEDIQEIASNPNLMSEDEMAKMLKLQWKKFEGEITKITNVAALSRMLTMATSEDADVTHRNVAALEARIEVLTSVNDDHLETI